MRFKKKCVNNFQRLHFFFHPNFTSFMIKLKRKSAKLLIYLNVVTEFRSAPLHTMRGVTRLLCSAKLRTTDVYATLRYIFIFPKASAFAKIKTLHKRRALCLIKITFLSHPIGEVVALCFAQFAETSFQDFTGTFRKH